VYVVSVGRKERWEGKFFNVSRGRSTGDPEKRRSWSGKGTAWRSEKNWSKGKKRIPSAITKRALIDEIMSVGGKEGVHIRLGIQRVTKRTG